MTSCAFITQSTIIQGFTRSTEEGLFVLLTTNIKDNDSSVLKYWQDRTLVGFNSDGTKDTTPIYGFNMNRFTSSPGVGGTTIIQGGSAGLSIDTNYNGISTSINSRTYYFGQNFINGVSNPEVQKYSGNIIHVDNRPSVTRSSSQKEDIKVILQF